MIHLSMYKFSAIFLIFLCSCVSNSHLSNHGCDTICVKLVTDSCHFWLDSANFVIDERKIEYYEP